MNFKKLFGFIELLVGITYLYVTTTIQPAAFGNPDAPKLFSYGLGGLLILVGIVSIIKDRNERLIEDKEEIGFGGQIKFIVTICIISALYILVFDHLGYILSTILFLELILYVFNKEAGFVKNTIIAVIFSIVMFFIFSELLEIRLPILPLLGY